LRQFVSAWGKKAPLDHLFSLCAFKIQIYKLLYLKP
jgi:hypothetical protein